MNVMTRAHHPGSPHLHDATRKLLESIWSQTPDLLTVTGPCGVGKSMLTRHLLRDVPNVHWISCRDHRALSNAVDANLTNILPSPILVFDDADTAHAVLLEHLPRWSHEMPSARFIVTSRTRLHLPQERPVEIRPLEPEQAMAALLEMSRIHDPGLRPSPDELASMERVARATGGLPIAMVHAARRALLMPWSKLATRLERRAHADLETYLEPIWEATPERHRAALGALSHFQAEFRLDDALAMLPADGLDTLQELREASMISQGRETGHLHIIPVVRDFARERLGDASHSRWKRHMLEQAERWRERVDSQGDRDALFTLGLMFEDLQRLLRDMMLKEAESPRATLHLMRALLMFVQLHAERDRRLTLLHETLPWLHALQPDPAWGDAFVFATFEAQRLQHLLGEGDENAPWIARTEGLAQDPKALAIRELMCAGQARLRGDLDAWGVALRAARARFDAIQGRCWSARIMINEANIDYWRGAHLTARQKYSAAQRQLDALGDGCHQAVALVNLTLLCAVQHDLKAGTTYGESAIEHMRALGRRGGEGAVHNALGMLAAQAGQVQRAQDHFERALHLQIEAGDPAMIAYTHANLAALAAQHLDEDAMRTHIFEALELVDPGMRSLLRAHTASIEADWHQLRGDLRGADKALERALAIDLGDEHHERVLLFLARRGALASMLGLPERATEYIAQARALEEHVEDETYRMALALHACHEQLESDWPHVRETLRRALEGWFESEPPAPRASARRSSWVRHASRALWGRLTALQRADVVAGSHPDALCLTRDEMWVRGPGLETWHKIGHRRNVRGLMHLLLTAHPGPVDDDEIIAALWPEEFISQDAAHNRIYNAAALLRGAGLRGILEKTEAGYALRQDLSIARIDAPANALGASDADPTS